MSRVKVKICGVRTFEEAKTALDFGADALGFNFWEKSPRYLKPDVARDLVRRLPPFFTGVGVFVNEEPDRIREICDFTGLRVVQLHGDEEPEFGGLLGEAIIIKAFRVGESFDVNQLKGYPASAFLLDAKVKGEYGGTGQRFDWRIAIQAKQFAPIILAGGMTTENVAEAIHSVQPFAIDVCSGVESAPGRKDLPKLREFLLEVNRAQTV